MCAWALDTVGVVLDRMALIARALYGVSSSRLALILSVAALARCGGDLKPQLRKKSSSLEPWSFLGAWHTWEWWWTNTVFTMHRVITALSTRHLTITGSRALTDSAKS